MILSIEDLSFSYGERHILRDVRLQVGRAEVVSVVGPSGSGKTSLLECVSGLVRPRFGAIYVDGADIASAPERERDMIRRRHVGIVFQSGNLVSELSLVENVELPLRLNGGSIRSSRKRALDALDQVGLGGLQDRLPNEVSGGELQRAAVARATVHGPSVVLADEPTGALDHDNSSMVADLLVERSRVEGSAVLLVSHDYDVALRGDRTFGLVDGELKERVLH